MINSRSLSSAVPAIQNEKQAHKDVHKLMMEYITFCINCDLNMEYETYHNKWDHVKEMKIKSSMSIDIIKERVTVLLFKKL